MKTPTKSILVKFEKAKKNGAYEDFVTLATDKDISAGFQAKVVDELPQEGEPQYIYLVPSDESNPDDTYLEYMWVEKDGTYGWEQVGTTAVTMVMDDAMSSTSENAVQNKVIKGYVDNTVYADPATKKKVAITNASKSGAGEDSIAIGDNATATNQYSIAIGNVAPATGKRAIAIGDKTSTAANAATGSSSISIGTNTQATGTSSLAICTRSVAGADGAIAIGPQATTSDEKSVAVGSQAKGHGISAIAIGSAAKTAPLNSDQGYNAAISIGAGSSAFGEDAVVIGTSAEAYTGNSENIEVPYGVAIGAIAAAKKDGAISIGYYSSASGKGSVALGPYASATAQGEINVGSSWNTAYGYNSTAYRLITGVHDGAMAHDVATYGQLNSRLGGLSLVSISQTDYDNLQNKDPDTLYVITSGV